MKCCNCWYRWADKHPYQPTQAAHASAVRAVAKDMAHIAGEEAASVAATMAAAKQLAHKAGEEVCCLVK